MLFAAQPNPFYVDTDTFERFLPRVVDRRDWTISPLSVPDDATAALSIAQPGSGRIWVGTAPDGRLGLAYTDDGGASWTDVDLPRIPDSGGELTADHEGHYQLLVAATGDHVAVTKPWTGFDDPHDVFVYVSADAGDNWTTVPIASAGLNGTEIFVLADQRLIVVLALDHYSERVLVSNSASDWSQLEEATYEPPARSHVDVNHDGILVNYGASLDPATFTTDLTQLVDNPRTPLIHRRMTPRAALWGAGWLPPAPTPLSRRFRSIPTPAQSGNGRSPGSRARRCRVVVRAERSRVTRTPRRCGRCWSLSDRRARRGSARFVQLRHLVFTAPDDLRARLGRLTATQLVNEAAKLRPRPGGDVALQGTKTAAAILARRVHAPTPSS